MNGSHAGDGSPTANKLQAGLPTICQKRVLLPNMDHALASALGIRLREARKRAKLSQTDVGIFAGLTHSAVGQWERGETLPETESLIRVANDLPASLDWLVWGVGNNIDARLRKLPDVLREPLIARIIRDIEDAEKLIHRLPPGFSAPVVADTDGRLNDWSAVGKAPQRETVPVRVKRKR